MFTLTERLFGTALMLARTVGWIAQLNEMIGDPEYKIGHPRQLFIAAPRHAPDRQALIRQRKAIGLD